MALATVYTNRAGDFQLTRLFAVLALVFAVLISVFVVPSLARAARVELGRIETSFRITFGGALFLAIFFVVAFAAWNTGNNLLFLMFSLLAATAFTAWAAARATLRELSVTARFPDHIFAGEAAPIIVTLENSKRALPSVSVLIEARSLASSQMNDTPQKTNKHAQQKRIGRRKRAASITKRPLAYFTYVPHRARAEQRIDLVFPQRGQVTINGFAISTGFPFGFFRFGRRLQTRDVELVIYPELKPVGDELHLLPMNFGQRQAMRRGRGQELYALRDYQSQDDVRHIDWKATARTNRFIVREFAAEDDRRVAVVFDTRPPAGEESIKNQHGRLERGVTLAASLVSHFVQEGIEVSLQIGTDAGVYDNDREHLYACLRRLALVRFGEHTETPEDQSTDFLARLGDATRTGEQRRRNASRSSGNEFQILLTGVAPGSVPAGLWARAHVIYL